jgi:hypothetical protein
MTNKAMTNKALVTTRRTGVELRKYAAQHPVGMAAAAFGVGYVLSGALFSKASARILGLGLRVAGALVVRAALTGYPLFTPAGASPVGN